MVMPEFAGALTMRPTIFIGLGGSGYEVVVRTKARFVETYPPELLQQMRFIVLDTDPDKNPVINSLGKVISLDAGKELVQIGGVSARKIKAEYNSYPDIDQELDLTRIPDVDLTRGAKQVRRLGRLAFLVNFKVIEDVMRNALREVLGLAIHLNQAGLQKAVNIYIVSSACGGTGSGFVLDLAYLVPYLAEQIGIQPSYIYTTGLLLLPEAFPEVPESNWGRIRANASAVLSELAYFQKSSRFQATYRGIGTVKMQGPPFKYAFLVGAENERGLTLNGMKELAPLLAEALYLQAGSYVGTQAESALDNSETTGYAVLGTASLRFHCLRMQQACAARLISKLVEDVFLCQPKEMTASDVFLQDNAEAQAFQRKVEQNVTGYVSTQGLGAETILSALRELPDNQLMEVRLSVDRLPPGNITANADRRCAEAEEKVRSEFLTRARETRVKLAEKAVSELDQFLFRTCDDLNLTLIGGKQFLETLDQALQATRERLVSDRENAQKAMVELRQVIRQRASKKLEEALQKNNWFGLRQGPTKQALAFYFERHRQLYQNLLEVGLCSEALTLLEILETRRQYWLKALASLERALAQAALAARSELRHIEENWRPDYLTETSYETPQDIPALYDRYAGAIRVEASGIMGEQAEYRLSQWLQQAAARQGREIKLGEEVQAWLAAYARRKFDRMQEDVSVEAEIERRFEDVGQQKEALNRLLELSAPLGNYDLSKMGKTDGELDTLTLVGIQDKNRSIYSSYVSGTRRTSLVSTHDRHRISVLQAKFGLSIYTLRQYGVYRRHFVDHLTKSSQEETLSGRAATPLICYRVVEAAVEAQRLFAIGEALGYIRREGVYFTVRSGEDEVTSQRLGKTLEDAVNAVITHEPIAMMLRQKKLEWETYRLSEMLTALGVYLTLPERTPGPLDQELRLLVESEWQKLKADAYL